jgi:hypothetical protein
LQTNLYRFQYQLDEIQHVSILVNKKKQKKSTKNKKVGFTPSQFRKQSTDKQEDRLSL